MLLQNMKGWFNIENFDRRRNTSYTSQRLADKTAETDGVHFDAFAACRRELEINRKTFDV